MKTEEHSGGTVVITGGAGGLGQALKAEFETAGWQVFAPGRDELDVTDSAGVAGWFDQLPALDLLINNAGVIEDRLLLQMTGEEFDRVLEVNLNGAFRCCRAAIKRMVKQRCGHIINVGSFSAMSGPAGQANYAAAKAGLIGLTQSLAEEYGPRNVRVNCVLPGLLETRMTRKLLENDEARAVAIHAHALRRFNTVSDAARFMRFLHTMEHVSGQVIQLDSRISRW